VNLAERKEHRLSSRWNFAAPVRTPLILFNGERPFNGFQFRGYLKRGIHDAGRGIASRSASYTWMHASAVNHRARGCGLWASGARPGIEGRVRERARARLEWDDVWDGTVVPAKVVRGPTVSARRSKTRRTGCHRGALFFCCCRSSFCAALALALARARRSIHRERLSHSFRLTFERAPPGKGAIATKNDRPSPLTVLLLLLCFFFLSFSLRPLFSRRWTVGFEIYRGHFRRCYRTRRVNIIMPRRCYSHARISSFTINLVTSKCTF